ncbi:heme o synthase [soil metagenome]
MKPTTDLSDYAEAPILATGHAARSRATARSRAVDFYELTKPRMNFLVVITTMVGYCMAGRDRHDWPLMVSALLGTALTAAGASVLNQYVERDLDKLMPRTRNRPLPAGRILPIEALAMGVSMGLAGTIYLAVMVNPLTAALGAITLLTYLFIYTPMKRYSSLNTVIGAIPGAIPPMMGWTAATGVLSVEAIALFAILFIWQMPHFLAIAILYKNDYAAGGFKMLPCVDDERLSITSRQIVLYNLTMIPVSLVPTVVGMAGAAYFTVAVLLGIAYLSFGISVAATRTRVDAKKLFFASIIYLPLLLAAMMIDRL